MALPVNSSRARKRNRLVNRLSSSKGNIVKLIGRDFNKSVANITGLLELLNDFNAADPDYKTICQYLSVEAKKLNLLVHYVCV